MKKRNTFSPLAIIDILLSLPATAKVNKTISVGMMMAYAYSYNNQGGTILGFQLVQAYSRNNG